MVIDLFDEDVKPRKELEWFNRLVEQRLELFEKSNDSLLNFEIAAIAEQLGMACGAMLDAVCLPGHAGPAAMAAADMAAVAAMLAVKSVQMKDSYCPRCHKGVVRGMERRHFAKTRCRKI